MWNLWVLSLAACAAASTEEPIGWLMPKEFQPEGAEAPAPKVPEERLSAPAPEGAESEVAEHHEMKAEEHEKEGEHELEEELEHEEELPDDVTWTTALLLMGFLVIGVGLLYLVHYPDEDIRRAMWGMVNTTLSIFCAATFDFSVFRFLHFQVVLSPPPRGLGIKHDRPEIKATVGFLFAALVSVVLNVLLFKITNQQMLFAVRTLGGHVFAFAGILTFAFLQESEWCRDSVWKCVGVAVLAALVMVLAYRISMVVAKAYIGEENWKDHDVRIQRGQAKEMQIDASAITGGFLLVQCLCYSMSLAEEDQHKFMPILEGYPSEHIEHTTWYLVGTAVGMLTFSAVWSICLRKLKGKMGGFMFEYIGVMSAVTGCWCLQRAGLYQLFEHFEDGLNTKPMASSRAVIVNAFVMSGLAVVCVCLFDKIADWAEHGSDSNRSLAMDQEDPQDAMSMASFISFPGDAETLSKVGDGLRTIISGFGMLVGICWDKAFETAHETVAETVPLFHSHPVIGTGLVAAVLIVFVVPAWYWYIVPNAMKAEEAHKEDILRENKRARESPTLTGLSSDEQESLTVDSDEKSLT